jgi:hypothetical protein
MGCYEALSGDVATEYLLVSKLCFPANVDLLNDPNVWIADTGATVHSTPSDIAFEEAKKATPSDTVTMGNGGQVGAQQVAKLPGMVCDLNGQEVGAATLEDVVHVPGAQYNLFSLSKMIRNHGWVLGGDDKAIWIQKGDDQVRFDIVIPTPKGALYCMYFKRGREMAMTATSPETKMNVMKVHGLLGHCNEDMTRATAKSMGWVLTGTWSQCEACAAGKAKQKNLPKCDHTPAAKGANRIFLDLSTVKNPKSGPKISKPNWRIMVDERTGMKFSDFYATKDGMVEPTCAQWNRWKDAGLAVKFVRLDNAGENKSLQTRAHSASWKLPIEFEFTARDTPQQNHLAEVGFATLANRGRAIMHHANVPMHTRYKLFPEAFKTATLLDGLVVITLDGVKKTRIEHWGGTKPSYANHLRMWGEAGTVKLKTIATPKIADRGVQCMFVGYALDHAGDVYRMWDPNTSRVHTTRDVIWLRRMFYEKPLQNGEIAAPIEFIDDWDTAEDPETISIVEAEEGDTSDIADVTGMTGAVADAEAEETFFDASTEEDNEAGTETRSGRTITKPTRLIEEMRATVCDIGLTAAEEKYYETMWRISEHGLVGAGIGGGFVDTNELHVMKYKEAMAGQDASKWEKAVEEEHDRMLKHRVWEPVPVKDLPNNSKVLTSTWAMKKKANGTYRARMNARGFEQINGVHYDETEKAAPVACEITIRIIMVLMVMASWWAELLDVQGAFLTGEMDPKMQCYLHVPEGFEKFYPSNTVLRLLKTLYGLKQSAYEFWKMLVMAMKHMGCSRSKADPCLFFKWTAVGLVLWVTWVDDCLVCGKKEAVLEAKKDLMSRFDCDEVGELTEYIGCKVDRGDGYLRLTQPVLLQSFDDEFDIPDMQRPNTPAMPGQVLRSGASETALVDSKMQSRYRSGTGKLLHLMKWSRPDILNSVRELSRFMTGATAAHLSAMYRVMKFCLATKDRGLTLRPNCKWDGSPDFEFVLEGESDSTYASDESAKSVSGHGTFLCGAPISMKSKTQTTSSLSVTESELISAVSCVQDLLFEKRVLESMGLKVKVPMVLKVDNKGVVDLVNNWSVGGRTRHITTKANFLRELKEEGVLKVIWFPTNDNSSDMFTKNLMGPMFEKHSKVYVSEEVVSTDSQEEGVGGRISPE